MKRKFLLLCIIFFVKSDYISGLHLVGEWNTSDFYKFLAKFGFQKTDKNDKTTQGYIYGNVTVQGAEENTQVSLVVLDSEYFLEFLNNRLVRPKDKACEKMFAKSKSLIWDSKCNSKGTEDFIRYIPCTKTALCRDENVHRVVPGSQMTFKIQDEVQPRYWYVSMVACTLGDHNNKTCDWTYNHKDMTIKYDLWMVNGDPASSSSNYFEHQFSIEEFDIFKFYLIFLFLHILIIPLQLYALHLRKHPVAILMLVCMSLQVVALASSLTHFAYFAANGSGCQWCHNLGRFVGLLAQSCFMLLLLLVLKGLSITSSQLPCASLLMILCIWTVYTFANVILFYWNLMAIQFISDVDEWQTLPGMLILSFRVCIMLFFLLQLRHTALRDHGHLRSRFYLHFGAGFMTWFIYLPLVVFVCSFISAFYRYKTILGVCCSVNLLSFLVTTHLLWPSKKYLHSNSTLLQDEKNFYQNGDDEDDDDDDYVDF